MTQTIIISNGKIEQETPKPKLSEVQLQVKENKLVITGLPDGEKLEYVLRDAIWNIFYVAHPSKENGGKLGYSLHIGHPNNLVKAEVTFFDRLRDGGTTTINYTLNEKEGTLHIPTLLEKNELLRAPTNTYDGKASRLENELR